MESVLDEF